MSRNNCHNSDKRKKKVTSLKKHFKLLKKTKHAKRKNKGVGRWGHTTSRGESGQEEEGEIEMYSRKTAGPRH